MSDESKYGLHKFFWAIEVNPMPCIRDHFEPIIRKVLSNQTFLLCEAMVGCITSDKQSWSLEVVCPTETQGPIFADKSV